MSDHQSPEAECQIGQVDRRAEGDPGDDAGEGDREHDEQREGLPPEETRSPDRPGRQRSEDQGHSRRYRRHRQRQGEGFADVGVGGGDAEPSGGQSRRRELEAGFLGRKGIEEDEKDRNVQKRQDRSCHPRQPLTSAQDRSLA